MNPAAPRWTGSPRHVPLPSSGPSPVPGKGPDLPKWVHRPGHGNAPASRHGVVDGLEASLNWSGLVDTGTTYTAVTGHWVVPAVQASTGPKEVATWIGIGGGSGTTDHLIQTGTTASTSGGRTAYSPWFELIPAPSIPIDEPVSPGDEMDALVKQEAASTWYIGIEDVTRDWVVTGTVTYTAGVANSAEWITERPFTGRTTTLMTLADYGSTRFHDLRLSGTDLTATGITYAYMTDTTEVIISYPSRYATTTTGTFTDSYGTPLPSVTSVGPSQGSTSGGAQVTITGTFIVPTLFESVHFGAYSSRATVNTAGTINATAPAEPAGTVDVTVTTTDGTSVDSSADRFTYEATVPIVTRLSPSTGPAAGGTTVTISGGGFTHASAVYFGSSTASFRVTSASTITATSPAGSGTVDVTVATPAGASAVASADRFTFVTGPNSTRIYGATADATAAAELEHQFAYSTGTCPGTTGTRPVILATDANYPDALSSAYLARHLRTGTLLTPTGSLSPPTLTAIHKEGITKVYVVGGYLAVSTAVVAQLRSTPADECGGAAALSGTVRIQVTRIAGATEYTTAADIAEKVPTSNVGTAAFSGAYAGTNSSGGDGRYNDTAGLASAAPSSAGALPTAVVATGKGFQDAESASTMAYAQSFPILLTTPSTLSPQASLAIKALGIRQVIVMGGQDAVSNGVVSSLEGLGVWVLRIAGATYSGTSTELASFETASTGSGLGWRGTGSVSAARGTFFTDGLAGAVVAAGGPLASTPEPLVMTLSPTSVGPALAAFLRTAGTTGLGGAKLTHFTILGGPDAVTQTTVDAMETDL